MNIYKYSITFIHDGGVGLTITTATSEDQAIKQFCDYEKCPRAAVTNIKNLGEIGGTK